MVMAGRELAVLAVTDKVSPHQMEHTTALLEAAEWRRLACMPASRKKQIGSYFALHTTSGKLREGTHTISKTVHRETQ